MRHKFGPGNPGRPKGALNKRTREAQELAAAMIEGDPEYLDQLKARVKAGKAPHMETLLWHYAYGKPKDQVDLNVSLAVAAEVLAEKLTIDELRTLHRLVGRLDGAAESSST